MDHAKVPLGRTAGGGAAVAGGAATVRPPSRYRGLVLLAVAAAGVGLAIRRQAHALADNERAQKNDAAGPNLYVSVDRSGGGI